MMNGFPLPQSPFDIRPTGYGTPGIGDGLPQNQRAEAFVWGQGGARLTPEQLLAQQEIARDQMQSDFSPVGHWTQGLGRVVDNAMGALDAKRLDKASQANKAESDAVTQALLSGGGDNAAIMQAMVNPYVSPEVRQMAGVMFKAQQPKQQNLPEWLAGYDELMRRGDTEGAAALKAKATQDNPWITATLPDGNFYSGPARGLAATFGGNEPKGGGQSISPQPGAVGSPAPATAGPGVPHLTVDQMRSIGQGVDFAKWQQREGTPVLVTSPEEMARVPVGTMVISPYGRRGVKK